MKNVAFSAILLIFFLFRNNHSFAQETISENKEITLLIKKKREYNKYNGSGYRIQLYNGLEKKAKSYKYNFEREFPGTYTKLSYDNPEWKVKVGSYRTRLDADRALNKIREKFSGAIIIEK